MPWMDLRRFLCEQAMVTASWRLRVSFSFINFMSCQRRMAWSLSTVPIRLCASFGTKTSLMPYSSHQLCISSLMWAPNESVLILLGTPAHDINRSSTETSSSKVSCLTTSFISYLVWMSKTARILLFRPRHFTWKVSISSMSLKCVVCGKETGRSRFFVAKDSQMSQRNCRPHFSMDSSKLASLRALTSLSLPGWPSCRCNFFTTWWQTLDRTPWLVAASLFLPSLTHSRWAPQWPSPVLSVFCASSLPCSCRLQWLHARRNQAHSSASLSAQLLCQSNQIQHVCQFSTIGSHPRALLHHALEHSILVVGQTSSTSVS